MAEKNTKGEALSFAELVKQKIAESNNQLTRAQAEQIIKDQLAHDKHLAEEAEAAAAPEKGKSKTDKA
ncbi:MAG: hypothetical protein LV479_09765 [Methylacidiphilales bacterium]|nr:hypothetical protein [Candidatus Methylacidiphilales bacterium]